MEIFNKSYCAEELADLNRDIYECFDPASNPVVASIPKDEYGFDKGTFVVRVEWIADGNA